MVDGFLERLAAGTLVSIDPDEMLIGNARVQINKYDNLARCVFLEGLVKCLLVRNDRLCKYVLGNLIGVSLFIYSLLNCSKLTIVYLLFVI